MSTPTSEDPDFAYILQALLDGGELSMDFNKVAKGAGMTLAGNASRKFQQILKKYGCKYEKAEGGLVAINSAGAASAPTNPAKKTTTKGRNGRAKKPSVKKRKLKDVDGGIESGTTSSKESNGSGGEENDTEGES